MHSHSSRGWFSYTLSYAFDCYPKIGRSSRIDKGFYSPQSVFTEGRANSKKVFIFTDLGVRLKCSKHSVKVALLVLKKAVTIPLVIDTDEILVTNSHKKSHFFKNNIQYYLRRVKNPRNLLKGIQENS